MTVAYECDSCGLCCTKLIIEADVVDALREPAIVSKCQELNIGHGIAHERMWMIACGEKRPCPFLEPKYGGERRCSVYVTRPGCCVYFQAGGVKCQEIRIAAGIGLLAGEPAKGDMAELKESLRGDEEAEGDNE